MEEETAPWAVLMVHYMYDGIMIHDSSNLIYPIDASVTFPLLPFCSRECLRYYTVERAAVGVSSLYFSIFPLGAKGVRGVFDNNG